MMDKLLLAWALLAIGTLGFRLNKGKLLAGLKEKSKLDVAESAERGTPLKGLAALLAFNLDKSAALVAGPHAPHANLRRGVSGQAGQGTSSKRMTQIEGGSRVHVRWPADGSSRNPSGPGSVGEIRTSQSDIRFPVAVRFDNTGETYNFAMNELVEVGDEPEWLSAQLAENAEKKAPPAKMTKLVPPTNELLFQSAETAENRGPAAKMAKLVPPMKQLDDGRASRAGPGPMMGITSYSPIFVVMWYSRIRFQYPTADINRRQTSAEGRSVVWLPTLAEASAFGKQLQEGAQYHIKMEYVSLSYAVYKMENTEMRLEATYNTNGELYYRGKFIDESGGSAEWWDAAKVSPNPNPIRESIHFRKRQPKLGGPDDGTLLEQYDRGMTPEQWSWETNGMGGDWRELTTKDSMDSVEEMWSELLLNNLGRELEVVNAYGDRVEWGDYPNDEDGKPSPKPEAKPKQNEVSSKELQAQEISWYSNRSRSTEMVRGYVEEKGYKFVSSKKEKELRQQLAEGGQSDVQSNEAAPNAFYKNNFPLFVGAFFLSSLVVGGALTFQLLAYVAGI